MNTSSLSSSFLVPLTIVLVIALCSTLGHLIASRYVEARHNLGTVFGGIFGILVAATVASFTMSPEVGIIASLITIIYTGFAVRLQRGY